MQQVLFYIPFTQNLFDHSPEGIPVYGFGAMLFLTFVVVAMVWGPHRVVKVGLPKDRLQDLAIVLFLSGIAGARVVYMIQYSDQFRGKNLIAEFFKIWNGGIVFYGSVFGGLIGYLLFYHFVLKRFHISGWKLADAVAPLIAVGLAIGRIGCYLNGCCWGQPVCEECQTVPLSPVLGEFPLLAAHARNQVVAPARELDRLPAIHGLQTSTGFTLAPPAERLDQADPQSVVLRVEAKSQAEQAGLKPGDRIVEVNGKPNRIVVHITGPNEAVDKALEILKSRGGLDEHTIDVGEAGRQGWIEFDTLTAYHGTMASAMSIREMGVRLSATDNLWELVQDWPRGVGPLQLVVERGNERIPITFTPKTVPFFPTQLYETISMLLLTFLLLAFQPFRRHDGQVMVLLMLGYAAHRFLNEAIRIEPTYAFDLTLSQWISVGIFATGILLELYLLWRMPRLPKGELPLSYGVAPPAPTATSA